MWVCLWALRGRSADTGPPRGRAAAVEPGCSREIITALLAGAAGEAPLRRPAHSGVEDVAEGVAEHVEGEHRQRDRGPRSRPGC